MANLTLGVTEVREITAALAESGYPDFTGYSLFSITRRLEIAGGNCGISESGMLISKINSDPLFTDTFVDHLLVETTELFRDPSVWKLLRDNIIPDIFKKNDHPVFWLPGCSTADDLVSLFLLLEDDKLFERSSIIVTSICEKRLKNIRAGRFDNQKFKVSNENYKKVTGKTDLSGYLDKEEGKLYWKKDMLSVADFLPQKSHLEELSAPVNCVIFRDKMIYFNLAFCNRVLDTIYNGLHTGGFLVTGAGETLVHTLYDKSFIKPDENENIFRKIG